MSDDLADVAGHDPRRERGLRSYLEQLSESRNDTLREMACAVLTGELSLRRVALSDAYSAELGEAFDTFWARYQCMNAHERDQLTTLGKDHLGHDKPA